MGYILNETMSCESMTFRVVEKVINKKFDIKTVLNVPLPRLLYVFTEEHFNYTWTSMYHNLTKT